MTRKTMVAMAVVAALVLTGSIVAAQGQTTPPQVQKQTTFGPRFVDANGDGICDNYQAGNRMGAGPGQGRGHGWGRGLGDGTGIGPKDGTGFGRGARMGGGQGTGICDGTGPKGRGRGPRR